jgi:uncharacterized damage-inducible protein DinB
MAGATRRKPYVPTAALLRAYAASAAVTPYLVARLDPSIWRAKPPFPGSKPIAWLVAHVHNCGLRYLERTAPGAAVPEELDRFRVTPAQAIRALRAKRKAVLAIVGPRLAGDGRIAGSPHSAAEFLAYYIAHDAHHRGQIFLIARMLGKPLDQETMAGAWQWSARARE